MVSNFNCGQCGSPIIDGPSGYVAGCEHYPIHIKSKYRSDIIVDRGVETDPEKIAEILQMVKDIEIRLDANH